MMNVPPSEAAELSLYDYEAMLWHWNEVHRTGEVDPPDPDMAMAILERANATPQLIH